MIKRTKLILFLSVLLAVLLFYSCGQNSGSSDTAAGTSSEDTTSTIPEFDSMVVLAEGKKANFSIIRAEKASDEVKSLAIELRKKLSAATGAEFRLAEDWISPIAEYDENTPEILLGYTNRKESSKGLDSIKYEGYSVLKIGSKIVMSAYTIEGLKKATEAFVAEVKSETNADGSRFYYIDDKIIEVGTTSLYFSGDRSIDKYKIIYNENEGTKNAADKIAKQIEKLTGKLPTVTTDKEKAGDYEILIGETTRSLTKKYLDSSSTTYRLDYHIVTDGNTLMIGASNSYMTGVAVDEFILNYMNPAIADRITLPEGYKNSALAYVGSASREFAEGANLRIMSWNILSEEWDPLAVFNGREYVVAQTLLYYNADVLGLQELSSGWYSKLEPLLKENYAFIHKKNTQNAYNYTGLAYNINTVKLIDSGMYYFKNTTKPRLRAVTWGLFEKLDGGERFIVMNTHWAINSEGAHLRLEAAEEMAELALSLIDKYKVPVFITGDYNCNETSDEFKLFMQKSGFADPKYDSRKFGVRCNTYHTIGTPAKTGSLESIDHITVSKDVELLYYNTLIDEQVTNSSDHLPIYIDVFIK